MVGVGMIVDFFFFQAEDGIRDAQESRGLGDVYKRQVCDRAGASAQPTGICSECVEQNELNEEKIISN